MVKFVKRPRLNCGTNTPSTCLDNSSEHHSSGTTTSNSTLQALYYYQVLLTYHWYRIVIQLLAFCSYACTAQLHLRRFGFSYDESRTKKQSPKTSSPNSDWPTLFHVMKICENEITTLNFLIENGILPNPKHMTCRKCKSLGFTRKNGSSGFMMRCSKHCTTESLLRGTFFGGNRLPLNEQFLLMYLYFTGVSQKGIQDLTGISNKTISDYAHFCRELVIEGMLFYGMSAMPAIGGPGMIVQIDESLFNKRKYERGRLVGGIISQGAQNWVFGGCRTARDAKGKMKVVEWFAICVPDRKIATLIPLIKKYIKKGTHVVSDMWKAYGRVPTIDENDPAVAGGELHDDEAEAMARAFLQDQPAEGQPRAYDAATEAPAGAAYAHDWVNHSENFVDPETGVHTNAIEGKWAGLKSKIPKKNRNIFQLDDFFWYLIWRERNTGKMWEAFLDLLRDVNFDGTTTDQPRQIPRGQSYRYNQCHA